MQERYLSDLSDIYQALYIKSDIDFAVSTHVFYGYFPDYQRCSDLKSVFHIIL
jgi:hypothetical protein